MKSHSINVFFLNLTLICMCTVVSNVSLNNICDLETVLLHRDERTISPHTPKTDSCSHYRNHIVCKFCQDNFCHVPVKSFVLLIVVFHLWW